jgi:hypothetical protein
MTVADRDAPRDAPLGKNALNSESDPVLMQGDQFEIEGFRR